MMKTQPKLPLSPHWHYRNPSLCLTTRSFLHSYRTFSRCRRVLSDCDFRDDCYDDDGDDAYWSVINCSRRYFHRSSRHDHHPAKNGDSSCGNGYDVVHDDGALPLSLPCAYKINPISPLKQTKSLLVEGIGNVSLVMSLLQHVGPDSASYCSAYGAQSTPS